ncbi:MAG: GNAT family N-acetyltransferase [Lautropia sp.]
MSRWIEDLSLQGEHVRLDPLAPTDAPGLRDAARDGELWTLWYTSVPAPDAVDAWIATAAAERERGVSVPFTIRRTSDGTIVGSTRYMNIVAAHRRLEIGTTWYRRSVQRTAANTECKLLLLAEAFDRIGCNGVELRTHAMNVQSRRAIERLGAKLDGVLRSHMVMPDGTLRDTCVYSILAHEWPAVRSNLRHRLGQARTTQPG